MSLDTAIAKIVSQYIPNTEGQVQQGWYLRLASYAARRAAELAPPLTAEDVEDFADDEPLSSDPSVAIHQLLARTGNPVTFNEAGATLALDPVAVLEDATDEQQRELALLGFFGQKGTRNDVDYSLWEQYYDQDADGNAAPKEQYATGGTWQAYLAGKGS